VLGSEAYEPDYQPDQHVPRSACRSHGGVLGRTAVGDHIPFAVPVQRHGGWQMVR
jgi:hypothetical protein